MATLPRYRLMANRWLCAEGTHRVSQFTRWVRGRLNRSPCLDSHLPPRLDAGQKTSLVQWQRAIAWKALLHDGSYGGETTAANSGRRRQHRSGRIWLPGL